ncbi:MAG TPA: LysR family transcriptional regulator [Prosthecobacter sp.]|nr:LysR family transcriptional regulator [Prosthecobacter sp.]
MELRHLRYFAAVAEHQNITRAAEHLHVSQPPLSRQIRDLEQELGVNLLERGPKQVRLTAAGRCFHKDVRRVLKEVDEAVLRVRTRHGGNDGELQVGYAPTPVAALLPAALKDFQRVAPRVKVVLHDLTTDEMMKGVMKSALDLALLVRPQERAGRGLAFTRLFDLPVGVIVPPGHAFARRRSVALDEVFAEPLVTYIKKGYSDYHLWLRGVLKGSPYRPKLLAIADGSASVIASVVAGQGLAFGPPTFVPYSGGRVKHIPLRTRVPVIEVGYLAKEGRTDGLLRTFTRCLEEAAKRMQ